MSQQYITDENGYILDEKLLHEEMNTLSNGCRLNLNFMYKHNIIAGAFAKAGEEITSAGETVADVATNTPKSWCSCALGLAQGLVTLIPFIQIFK